MTDEILNGKPYAGNPHVRFDEGEVASAEKPRRGSLLYKKAAWALTLSLVAAAVHATPAPVNASSFGFDPADATRCLQAAIDSGAAKVVVDRQASDWIVRPIRLRSGQEVVFAQDVVVRAMPGAFTNRSDSLFLAENVRDVVLRGEGRAVLKMRKADYDDKARYVHSEWRHVLTLRRARNVRVLDLALESSGGDGIYVDKCENVSVERVLARDNYRQGMSVICVKGLVVRDSRFCDTSGASSGPWAGIDFEPNEPGESITGVLVENCEFTGNRGGGFGANLSRLTSNSKPVDITVRNCRIYGNRVRGVGIAASHSSPVGGRIAFENCSVAGGESHVLGIVGKSAGELVVSFRDCTFDGRGCAAGAAISFKNMRFQTFGAVHFERSRVFLGEGQRALDYVALPENGMADVTGTLAVTRADGARDELSLEDFAAKRPPDPVLKAFHPRRGEIASLRPVNPDAKRKPRSGYMWFRDLFSFAQYVPAAGE